MTLIILDRDGVINHDSPARILHRAQWQPIVGSIPAIVRLSRAGHRVAVASNQSAIGLGLTTAEEVESIHAGLCDRVCEAGGMIAAIAYCPHAPDAHCSCRKPAPGLLLQLIGDLGEVATDCWMVGDSMRDVAAGRAAGVRQVLVRTGNGGRDEGSVRRVGVHAVFDNLADFAAAMLRDPSGRTWGAT